MVFRTALLLSVLVVGAGIRSGAHPGGTPAGLFPQDRVSLEVTYIANEGFLVTAGPAKLLIDALHENPWGYESTPDSVFVLMLAGDAPFDGVDLMVASHAHADHFSPGLTHEYLVQHPEVVFVGSRATLAELRDSVGADFATIEERAREITPAWGETGTVGAGEVSARFLTLNHTDSPTEPVLTLGSLVDLGGRTILHLADLVPETSSPFLEGYGLAEEGIDVAFVDSYFATSEVGQTLLREHIRPDHIVLMHVRPHEQIAVREGVTQLFPEAFVFGRPMETRVYR